MKYYIYDGLYWAVYFRKSVAKFLLPQMSIYNRCFNIGFWNWHLFIEKA